MIPVYSVALQKLEEVANLWTCIETFIAIQIFIDGIDRFRQLSHDFDISLN